MSAHILGGSSNLNCYSIAFDSKKDPVYDEGEIAKRTIKKYFDVVGNKNNDSNLKVKRKYLSMKSILTILCFMCDNNYIITSDNDGFYIANYWIK